MGKQKILPPENWQDFERYTRVLFQCILKNKDVKRYGRQGQPQHGIDIFGYDYSNGESDRMIGVQCKGKDGTFGKNLTKMEIKAEIEKAKNFTYPISEFYILTTAQRDAKVQDAVLEIIQESLDLEFTISVWGWEDIEEKLWENANSEARKCFDPSYNPLLESLEESLKGLKNDVKDIISNENDASEVEIKLQEYYEMLSNGKPETAYDRLEKIEEKLGESIKKLDKYKILTYKGICLFELGKFEESANFLLDAYDIEPEKEGADARKVIALAFLGKVEEAVKFGESAIATSKNKEMLCANIIHAKINLPTQEEFPFGFVDKQNIKGEDIELAKMSYLRSKKKSKWRKLARQLFKKYPKNDMVELFYAHALLEEVFVRHDATTNWTIADKDKSQLQESINLLAAIEINIRDTERAWKQDHINTICNLSKAYMLINNYELAKDILDRCMRFAPNDSSIAEVRAQIAIKENDIIKMDELYPKLSDSEDSLLGRLNTIINTGNWEKINEMPAIEYTEIEKNYYKAFYEIGHALATWKAYNTSDIKEIAQDIISRYPKEAVVYILSYHIANDINDMEWKRKCYSNITELCDNMNQDDKSMFANIAILEEDFEAIIQLFENNINYNEDSENLRHLATAYANSPLRKSSIEFIDKLGEDLKRQLNYPLMIGLIEYKKGNFTDAESYFKTSINNEPDNLQGHLLLIGTFNRNFKEEELKEYLKTLDVNNLMGPPSEKMQLAALLIRAQEVEKGLNYAYKVACNNLDVPHIPTMYIGLFLSFMDNIKVSEKSFVTMDSYVEFLHDNETHGAVFIEGKNNISINNDIHGTKAKKLFLGHKKGENITDNPEMGAPSEYKILNIFDKPTGLYRKMIRDRESLSADNLGVYEYNIQDANGNINIDALLDDLKKRGSARKQQSHDFSKLYREKEVPLFSLAISEMDIDIMLVTNIIRKENYNIRTCTGNMEELDKAIEVCKFACKRGVVLDTYTAIIAHETGILQILKLLFSRLIIPQSVMNEALVLNEKAKQIGDAAMWHDPDSDENYFDEFPPEKKHEHILNYEKMIDEFRSAFEILPGEHPSTPTKGELDIQKKYISSFEPGYLCVNENLPILSDDMHYRQLLKESRNVEGIWLQAPLLLALRDKKIDIKVYTKLLAKLAELRHSHIFLDIEVLKEACKLDDEVEFHSLSHLLSFLVTPNYSHTVHVKVLKELSEFIWNNEENSKIIDKKKVTQLLLNRWKFAIKQYKGLLIFLETMDTCIKNSKNTELEKIVHEWLEHQGLTFA